MHKLRQNPPLVTKVDKSSVAKQVNSKNLSNLIDQFGTPLTPVDKLDRDTLRKQITDEIVKLMRLSNEPINIGETTTVEDLDQLNKDAARAKTELDLTKITSQTIQTKNRLVARYQQGI